MRDLWTTERRQRVRLLQQIPAGRPTETAIEYGWSILAVVCIGILAGMAFGWQI